MERDLLSRFTRKAFPNLFNLLPVFRMGCRCAIIPPLKAGLPLARLNYVSAYVVWVLASFGCFVSGIWCCVAGVRQAGLFPTVHGPAPRARTAQLYFCSGSRRSDANRVGNSGLWPALMLHKFQTLIPTLFIFLLKTRGRIPAEFLGRGVLLFSILRHWLH